MMKESKESKEPKDPKEPSEPVELRLYVTGHSTNSQRAMDNLRRICEKDLAGQYRMTVVDVLERPQLAEEDRVLATPTLVKSLPPPVRRVIGDLSEKDKVLLGLDVIPANEDLDRSDA